MQPAYTFVQEQFIIFCIPFCPFDENFNVFGRVCLSDCYGFKNFQCTLTASGLKQIYQGLLKLDFSFLKVVSIA